MRKKLIPAVLFTLMTAFCGYTTYQWQDLYHKSDKRMLMLVIERELLTRALADCVGDDTNRHSGPNRPLDHVVRSTRMPIPESHD
jgi:hypothetical protein